MHHDKPSDILYQPSQSEKSSIRPRFSRTWTALYRRRRCIHRSRSTFLLSEIPPLPSPLCSDDLSAIENFTKKIRLPLPFINVLNTTQYIMERKVNLTRNSSCVLHVFMKSMAASSLIRMPIPQNWSLTLAVWKLYFT